MAERNALAELAERMTPGIMTVDDIITAREIIAELAKADLTYANDPVTNNCVKLQLDAFKKCREIAEEGATK